jgi:outer membrane protein assembly factor BamB
VVSDETPTLEKGEEIGIGNISELNAFDRTTGDLLWQFETATRETRVASDTGK